MWSLSCSTVSVSPCSWLTTSRRNSGASPCRCYAYFIAIAACSVAKPVTSAVLQACKGTVLLNHLSESMARSMLLPSHAVNAAPGQYASSILYILLAYCTGEYVAEALQTLTCQIQYHEDCDSFSCHAMHMISCTASCLCCRTP